MRLKIFRAPTVAAAMAQLRAELGAEALILATRRTATGVELTAALEPTLPIQAQHPQPDPAELAALHWHGIPTSLAASLATRPLAHALAETFTFTVLDPTQQPLLLAGPPGAGKTLTTARLATRLVLQGITPLVISTDGDRAGAAEQLAAFTRLLGLVLVAAPDPLTLARALARRTPGTPVLIDTPGIDPFAPHDQARIATLAATANARTALVLPAGLDPAEAADTAHAFRAAGATLLAPTRLDIARRLGAILGAAHTGLALTETANGPGAADALNPITPQSLALRLAPPQNRKAA